MNRILARGVAVSFLFLASSALADGALVSLQMNGQSAGTGGGSDPIATSGVLQASIDNTQVSQGSSTAAAADLTAGTLRVFTKATDLDGSVGGFPTAEANFGDTITISGPGSTVDLTLTLTVDGTMLIETGSPPYAPNLSISELLVADVQLVPPGGPPVSAESRVLHGLATDSGGNKNEGVTFTPADAGNGAYGAIATVTATVPVGQPIPIGATLDASGMGFSPYTVTSDYGSTGRLAVTLPGGYTFTSASGKFLSRPGDPGLALDGGNAPSGSGGSDGGVFGDDAGSPKGDGGSTGGGADAGTSNGDTGGGGGDSGGCNTAGTSSASFAITALLAVLFVTRRRKKNS